MMKLEIATVRFHVSNNIYVKFNKKITQGVISVDVLFIALTTFYKFYIVMNISELLKNVSIIIMPRKDVWIFKSFPELDVVVVSVVVSSSESCNSQLPSLR